MIEAMAELGVDLHASGAAPKRLTDAIVESSNVVTTMGDSRVKNFVASLLAPPD